MFNKLTTALVLAAPLVNALTISIPKNPQSSGQVTIDWTFDATTDPSIFSFELTNNVFHHAFAIANNVQLVTGTITLTLPVVPVGDGYTIEAVNIGDINQVYAQTGDFAIAANSATTSSSTSSSAAVSSSVSISGSGSASSGSVKTTTLSVSASVQPTSSTGFGTTLTSPASQASNSGSASASSSAAATTFGAGNGAVGAFNFAGNMGMIAAAVLSAVAGAAVVAL